MQKLKQSLIDNPQQPSQDSGKSLPPASGPEQTPETRAGLDQKGQKG